jgi:hypothetical protein
MCQRSSSSKDPGTNYGYNAGSGIIGGAGNCFCTGGVHSIILSGRCNFIKSLNWYDVGESTLSGQKFTGGRSAVLAGERNCLIGPKVDGSLILAGCTNSITSHTLFSAIVSGCRNTIGTSSNSIIIGGSENTIFGSTNSVIIGGSSLTMSLQENFVYVPSIRGFGSVQFDLKTASTDYTLTQQNFTFVGYPSVTGLTVSLPIAAESPHRLYVIKKDGSSTQSIVYINPNTSAGDTIEGYSGSIELINPWDYNILQSDGVNLWIKLGGAVGLNL